MSRDPIRNSVINLYPNSETWAKRVEAMPRDQVYAIYCRDQEQREARKAFKGKPQLTYVQGTLF
jgi:hypothetical protein